MENLVQLFQGFALSDTVDILIVSVILYRFLRIIQGTRAVQILTGTALVTTLYWVSLTYDLYALNWILKSFFDYFFIILIILFKDQIQSALAGIGHVNFFMKKSKSMYDIQVEEVVMACSALSREKTGALIVFEKKHGLLNYASTGTKLDARIHSDLLYSLFQPTSPLHDGAVILYKNQIQAAGCFLPLSKNIDLDRKFGTRHRAAMGVSEVSDAVVVVVSEETGQINICNNGVFTVCDDEQELRKQLRSSLYRNADYRIRRRQVA